MRIGLVAPASEQDRDLFLREKLPELVGTLAEQGFHVVSVEFQVGPATYSVKSLGSIATMALENYERALKA